MAWIQALTNAGLKIDLETYAELECLEVGDTSTFETLVFTKEDCSDVDVFMSFMNCIADYMDVSLPSYEGWDAKIMYEFIGGKLLGGSELFDTRTGARSRFACRVHKQDDTCILWYINNNGNVHLEYHDIAQKDDCLEAIQNARHEAEQLGYIDISQLE